MQYHGQGRLLLVEMPLEQHYTIPFTSCRA